MENSNSKVYTAKELESMTVAQLREIAVNFGAELKSKIKKAELVTVILDSYKAAASFAESKQQLTADIPDTAEPDLDGDFAFPTNGHGEPVSPTGMSQGDYINSIKVGMIIAFKTDPQRAISAKVTRIYNHPDGAIRAVFCETRNGMKYTVPRNAIAWVKTGNKWPRRIFEMFLPRDRDNDNNNQ